MRRAIRGAARIASIALAIVPLALCACSTVIRVAFDGGEDFSRFRTWSWHPSAVPTIETPRGDAAVLDAALARSIAGGLGSRGYERVEGRTDLYVTYQISIRRRVVLVEVPRAPYLLSSLSSSASYWIEGSDTRKEVREDLRLWIDVVDREGRWVWRAALQRPVDARGGGPDVEEAVASLLERLPPRSGPAPGR